MNWTRGDTYYLRSGDYTIARVTVGTRDQYELWKGRMHVSSHGSAGEAKEAAEAHSIKFQGKA